MVINGIMKIELNNRRHWKGGWRMQREAPGKCFQEKWSLPGGGLASLVPTPGLTAAPPASSSLPLEGTRLPLRPINRKLVEKVYTHRKHSKT